MNEWINELGFIFKSLSGSLLDTPPISETWSVSNGTSDGVMMLLVGDDSHVY